MKALIRTLQFKLLTWRAERYRRIGDEQGYLVAMRQIRTFQGKPQAR
ncbi:hypothetical protein [Neorhizobium sp. NCHU2750]|nr:hypothetical protein NCHU2750_24030 [Neorhizobium sp. NCHU2750]